MNSNRRFTLQLMLTLVGAWLSCTEIHAQTYSGKVLNPNGTQCASGTVLIQLWCPDGQTAGQCLNTAAGSFSVTFSPTNCPTPAYLTLTTARVACPNTLTNSQEVPLTGKTGMKLYVPQCP